MSDLNQDGAPFFFATQQPPTAAAIDEDIYLTVTAGVPTHPDQVDLIAAVPRGQSIVIRLPARASA